jgi:hypothetical protein
MSCAEVALLCRHRRPLPPLNQPDGRKCSQERNR